MLQSIYRRQDGRDPAGVAPAAICRRRVESLALSAKKEVASAHSGNVTWLDVDQVECRYLLAGSNDCSIAIYDTQVPDEDSPWPQERHGAVGVVERGSECAHKFHVSGVQWYPVDTGMFVSGSFDHHVHVWDTNTLEVVTYFGLPAKVYGVSMSAIASTHCLVAAATGDPRVRLCDVASGAFTHTLTGHREAVWAVAWSRSSEHVLATGSSDGTVLFWDIRRAGAFMTLDQHNARPARLDAGGGVEGGGGGGGAPVIRRGPAARPDLAAKAHNDAVTSLCPTWDGLHMLTSGRDSRMRLWDLSTGRNTLVNYPGTHNFTPKAMQLAVSRDGRRVYHPCRELVQVYDTHSGRAVPPLGGHFDAVNCVAFHPTEHELYSGGNDRQILVWCPPPPPLEEEDMEAGGEGAWEEGGDGTVDDEDAWSD